MHAAGPCGAHRAAHGALSPCLSPPLPQRYISTRPMFIDVRELSAAGAGGPGPPGGAGDAAGAGMALRDLGQLYKGLLAAVKEEALVMEQVCDPHNPLKLSDPDQFSTH